MKFKGNISIIFITSIYIMSWLLMSKFLPSGIIYNGVFLISLLIGASFYKDASEFLGGIALLSSLLFLIPVLTILPQDLQFSTFYVLLLTGGVYLAIICDGLKFQFKSLFSRIKSALSDISGGITLVLFTECAVLTGYINYIFLSKVSTGFSPYHIPPFVTLFIIAWAEELVLRNTITAGSLKIASKTVTLLITPLAYTMFFISFPIIHLFIIYITGLLLTFIYIWKRNLKLNVFFNFAVKMTVFGLPLMTS